MSENVEKIAMRPSFPIETHLLGALGLDLRNSRYPRDATSQDDAILLMMTTSGEQCMDLLRDLTRFGQMNSADIPIVVKRDGRLVVVEGNRRLTCLRLWTDPPILEKHLELEDKYGARVRRLVQDSQFGPPTELRVTVAPSEDAANTWIERKHSGGAGGAGTVEWGAAMKDRRKARNDPSKRSRALAFIERVSVDYEEDSELSSSLEEVRTQRYTMIQRFIDRVPVRERLGLDLEDGQMSFRYGASATKPIIARVLSDFAKPKAESGKTWARELDTVGDFEKYLDGYAHLLPGPKRVAEGGDPASPPREPADVGNEDLPTPDGSGSQPASNFAPETPGGDQHTRPPRPTPKNDYIFRGLTLDRFTNRIQEIVRQTSLLSVTRNSEVVPVMLRVVLELTCYQFLKSHSKEPERHLDKNIRTAIKIIEPNASDALGQSETTSALAKAFHETTANSIRLVQYAVHDVHSGRTPSEVTILADRYGPVLAEMNANMGAAPIT